MAFDPDAYLAETAPAGGFDPDAYLKETGGARETTDMGPEARRARAGRPAGPGTSDPSPSGPIVNPRPFLGLRDPSTGAAIFPSPSDYGGTPAFHSGAWTNNPEEAGDTLVQSGLLGHGAGVAASSALKALGAAPVIQKVGGAAAGGGVGAKTAGGDFTTGALLGGGLAALGPAARAAVGRRNPTTDVTANVSKASKVAKDVKFRGGEGGAELAEVLKEVPTARRAVMTEARTNPASAAKTLTKVIDDAVDANDAAYAAIQRQHGGVPLQPIAERLAGLEERLNLQGRGVAADAVNRVRTDLLKRYGATPEGLETAKLTAQQVRNIRNDMGTVAFGDQRIPPNTKRQALSKIYGVLNKEIEDVAANTSGVNLADFQKRNRQISMLIPVRDALTAGGEKLADRTLMQKAKSLPGNAIRRGVREVEYAIADAPDVPAAALGTSTTPRDRPAPVGVPADFVAAMRGEQAPP